MHPNDFNKQNRQQILNCLKQFEQMRITPQNILKMNSEVSHIAESLRNNHSILPNLRTISSIRAVHNNLFKSILQSSHCNPLSASYSRGIEGLLPKSVDVLKLTNSINIGIDFSQLRSIAKEAEQARSRTQSVWREMQMSLPNLHNSSYRSLPQFAAVGIVSQNERLTHRLLSPQRTFNSFVEHTSERLSTSRSKSEAKALAVSLEIADAQLALNTQLLSEVIEYPEDSADVSLSRSLVLPFVQQEELIIVSTDNDIDEYAAQTLSGRVMLKSRQVLILVKQCNEAARISAGVEIFKPTTKLLEVYSELPWLLSINKRSFGDFIDCLYFLFYESAGKDKLRFIKDNGGFLNQQDKECEIIWCVKHLRNKWIRHDVEHGSETDIRKSWSVLSKQFVRLGLGHCPVSHTHFQHLHLKLLDEAAIFLSNLLNRVVESQQISD